MLTEISKLLEILITVGVEAISCYSTIVILIPILESTLRVKHETYKLIFASVRVEIEKLSTPFTALGGAYGRAASREHRVLVLEVDGPHLSV